MTGDSGGPTSNQQPATNLSLSSLSPASLGEGDGGEAMARSHGARARSAPQVSDIESRQESLRMAPRDPAPVPNPYAPRLRLRQALLARYPGRHLRRRPALLPPRPPGGAPSPFDVPLGGFQAGWPTAKPNLYEGYHVLTERERRQLRTPLYLSAAHGRIPILYDPLHKVRKAPPPPQRPRRHSQ